MKFLNATALVSVYIYVTYYHQGMCLYKSNYHKVINNIEDFIDFTQIVTISSTVSRKSFPFSFVSGSQQKYQSQESFSYSFFQRYTVNRNNAFEQPDNRSSVQGKEPEQKLKMKELKVPLIINRYLKTLITYIVSSPSALHKN